MKNNRRKLEPFFEDDDMYHIRGMSTRPYSEPVLKDGLIKWAVILLVGFFFFAGVLYACGVGR